MKYIIFFDKNICLFIQNYKWSSFSNVSVASPTSQLILQPFRRFTYVSAHSPTLPLLHLRHSSFSNLSITSPTSQLILQPFCHFTYVTAHFPTLSLLHLRHNSFSNPSFTSPTSQALHLIHLASSPWYIMFRDINFLINFNKQISKYYKCIMFWNKTFKNVL